MITGPSRQYLDLVATRPGVLRDTMQGTGHWFANSAVESAYDPDAAALAFERTVDFLHQNLA